MGDRSITIFRCKDSRGNYDYSPQCYLHSLGYDTLNIIKRAKLRGSAPSYSAARFIAQCCEESPGNLGVGVFDSPDKTATYWLDAFTEKRSVENICSYLSHGNNGVFLVDLNSRDIFQFSNFFEGDSDKEAGKARFKLVGRLEDVHYKDDMGIYAQKNLKSAVLDAYEYDPATEVLILTFKTGAKYKYESVPRQIVIDMTYQTSYGKYVNARIKPAYKGVKIEDKKAENQEIDYLKEYAATLAGNLKSLKAAIEKLEAK